MCGAVGSTCNKGQKRFSPKSNRVESERLNGSHSLWTCQVYVGGGYHVYVDEKDSCGTAPVCGLCEVRHCAGVWHVMER